MMPTAPVAVPTASPVLRAHHLSKTYPGTKALHDATLELERGEIHALLGGNGSGKSTLVKILAGVHQADPGGTITLDGPAGERRIDPARINPDTAKALGLRFVHQDPGVFDDLTVAENLALGRGFELTAAGRIRWRAQRRRAAQIIDRFGLAATPATPVARLRPAMRTMLAIARALQDDTDGDGAGILVLDEPTASLPQHEAQLLLTELRRQAAAGRTVLFISHHLDEVLHLVDRVTVLRDGRNVATVTAATLTEDRLVELIVGRPLDRVFPDRPPLADKQVALEVRGLASGPLRNIDLTVHRGEVLGVAGLLGSGRSTLLRTLFADLGLSCGQVLLEGRPIAPRTPREAVDAGFAYVPEDRLGDAAFPDLGLRENIGAASVADYWRRMRLAHSAERADAGTLLTRHRVKAASTEQPLLSLSGGNQQKVILARWLRRAPKVLLLDEPTQGVDVGARAEIYTQVRDAAAAGAAVLLVASDLEELARVSDRVIVLRDGTVTADLGTADLDPVLLAELSYKNVPGPTDSVPGHEASTETAP